MELLRVVYRNYRWPFAGVMLLSLASAALGVGIIAFINQRLVAASAENEALAALPGFIGLLVLLLAVSLAAQLSLTALGHWFVYELRGRLIKRILDTDIERIEQIGSAHLLASISSDVHSVTVAFVRLPELVQGTILTLGSVIYLYTLSPPMLAVIAVWIGFTMAVGAWLVKRVYTHFHQVREIEDRLYKDFEAVIAGRKELALNRHRARRLYETKYESDAREYKHHIIRADTYHLSANNWANIMMLGAIGIGFFLANGLGWANTATAATFALTVLFLRTPMIQAVGAFPTLLAAQVALEKLDALALAPHRASFDEHEALPSHWHEIELRDVCYQYPAEGDRPGFRVGPINLRLQRGEQVFLIGGNGSGKTTLARLLTGLYRPRSGQILVDGEPVSEEQWQAYRALFASVFTDFYLFDTLMGKQGAEADAALVESWLSKLGMEKKLNFVDQRVNTTQLSQGQRKRLALLMAIGESRDILLLDEWAADQDPVFRRIFYRELLPALRQAGQTVFAISHDDTYFSHADRSFEMRAGQFRELTGTQRQLATDDAVSRVGSSIS